MLDICAFNIKTSFPVSKYRKALGSGWHCQYWCDPKRSRDYTVSANSSHRIWVGISRHFEISPDVDVQQYY